ncbi:MAG: tetratricopeptide repeat protein [Pseudomonadota bacterium]
MLHEWTATKIKPISWTRAAILAGTCLGLGACAQSSNTLQASLASGGPAASETASAPQSELQKATAFWAKKYAEKPHDPSAALSYAKNLKALGDKRRAFAILQQASLFAPQHKGIASEYGRLALENNKVQLANRLLTIAYNPSKPDWRVLSARGVALGRLGDYRSAVQVLEQAAKLAPKRASVLNNLAMAHVAMGEPAKAETILRPVALSANASPKLRKNLALALSLQGRYTEAKAIAAQDGSAAKAYAQIDQVKRMVRIPEQRVPGSQTLPTAVSPITTSSTR